MKKLILLIAIFVSFQSFAQNISEFAPGMKPINPAVQEDTFDLYFSFPTIAFIGEYGAESDGNIIYATQWLDDSLAAYDLSGNLLEKFTIYGVEKVRDLAYDGQYYYGSPSEFYFYVLDLDNKIAIDTVFTSFRIRGMAYDPNEDVLWASEHWSPMFYKMDKQGNVLDSWLPSGITMDAISGLAYDYYSPGGPFLWGFSQDSSGAMIVKYDVPNQAQTGNMIDVSGLVTDMTVAGGLYLEDMDEPAVPVIGGVIQNRLHFALELDYANMLVGLEEKDNVITLLEIYPNPVWDILNIKTDIREPSEVHISIHNQLGMIEMNEIMTSSRQATIKLNVSELEGGIYFLRLTTNEQSITSRFVKAK